MNGKSTLTTRIRTSNNKETKQKYRFTGRPLYISLDIHPEFQICTVKNKEAMAFQRVNIVFCL